MRKLLFVIVVSLCTSFALLANDVLTHPVTLNDSTVQKSEKQEQNKDASTEKVNKAEKPSKAETPNGTKSSTIKTENAKDAQAGNEPLNANIVVENSVDTANLIRAKVAYWLNGISLRKANEEYWGKISGELAKCKSVSEIKDKIDGEEYTNNIKLCNEISQIDVKYDSGRINNMSVPEFAGDILKKFSSYGSIKDLNNDEKQRNVSIKEFEMELAKVLPIAKIESGDSGNHEEAETINEDGQSSTGMTVMWIICILFLLIILFLVFILFRKNKAFMELSENYDDLSERYNRTKNDCKVLTDKLNDERRSREKITAEFQDYKEQVVRDVNRESKAAVDAKAQTSVQSDIYVGMPQNGEFVGSYPSYKAGKTMYKITTNRSDYGTFELIVNNETLSFARQSKTIFLEPACDLENDISSFSNITTIRKGTVQFVNNVWKIVNKAVIRLS